MKNIIRAIVVTAALSLAQAGYANDSYSCKNVGSEWTWFSDHVVWSIDYVLVGPQGREFEIGTGVSVGGRPQGSHRRATHIAEITAYGAGALHVRKIDGGTDFKVCATSLGVDPITIYTREF